jgi:hypothetical protein
MDSTSCSICNDKLLSNYNQSFATNHMYEICSKCYTEGKQYYTDYMLRVTFEIQTQNHDGYCSGADVTTNNYTQTKVIPLTKLIKQEDMDEEGNIDPLCKYLNFYNKHSGCDNLGGSGYCKSENYTIIKNAKIVKKRRKVKT